MLPRRLGPHARRKVAAGLALLGAALALGGCAVRYIIGPWTHATAWTRVSGEYAATTLQVYANAGEKLDLALGDPTWSSSLEQKKPFAHLPPAVIVDLDETVLDNTKFHAMLDEEGLEFDLQLWAEWVEEADADAVPGAAEFLKRAAERKIAIFYITNRDHPLEAATRENLRELGLPLASDFDCVLTRGEQPDWGSDKTSRRQVVAATHRVLLNLGDSLGDFAEQADDLSARERRRFAFAHREKWGQRWFVLPNPIYGGWERALDDPAPGPPGDATAD